MFLLFIGPIVAVAVAIIATVVIVSSVGAVVSELKEDEE